MRHFIVHHIHIIAYALPWWKQQHFYIKHAVQIQQNTKVKRRFAREPKAAENKKRSEKENDRDMMMDMVCACVCLCAPPEYRPNYILLVIAREYWKVRHGWHEDILSLSLTENDWFRLHINTSQRHEIRIEFQSIDFRFRAKEYCCCVHSVNDKYSFAWKAMQSECEWICGFWKGELGGGSNAKCSLYELEPSGYNHLS